MANPNDRSNLEFLVNYINSEIAKVRGTSTLTATVEGTSPLRIRLDGDDAPLPYTPASTTATGGVGSRVLVSVIPRTNGSNGRFIVTGSIDGGWNTLPLITTAGAGFTAYNTTDGLPRYILRNGIVTVTGAVSPNSSRLFDTTVQNIARLPEGFRPAGNYIRVLCQGSGTAFWTLSVYPDGYVGAARYRDTNVSGYGTPGTNTWMPFHVTFPVN